MVGVLDVTVLDIEVEVVTACARCLLVAFLYQRFFSKYCFLFSLLFVVEELFDLSSELLWYLMLLFSGVLDVFI